MQQANFNTIAANYDSDFSSSKIGILQRNRVWHHLKSDLNQTKIQSILEINCGTGVDAFLLEQQGYSVIATDISSEMIHYAKQKLKNTSITNPEFLACGFNDLKNVFAEKKFDLIFSNFAGLNCINEKEFKQLNHDFNGLLNPNALLIIVLLGKKSWIERLYFLLKGNSKKAFRRENPDLANLGNNSFQMTYCYTVNEVKDIFKDFICINNKPIGILIPPSYLEPLIKKLPFLKFVLQFAESLIGGFSFLSDYADHTYLVFRKK